MNAELWLMNNDKNLGRWAAGKQPCLSYDAFLLQSLRTGWRAHCSDERENSLSPLSERFKAHSRSQLLSKVLHLPCIDSFWWFAPLQNLLEAGNDQRFTPFFRWWNKNHTVLKIVFAFQVLSSWEFGAQALLLEVVPRGHLHNSQLLVVTERWRAGRERE